MSLRDLLSFNLFLQLTDGQGEELPKVRELLLYQLLSIIRRSYGT
jgi:hypothetical protein